MSAHRVGPLLQGEFHNWIRVYRAKLEFMPSSVQKNGEGNGHPLQYAFLENPTDRGAWQVTVRGVTRVGHDLATKPAPKRVRGLASEWEVSVKTARCSVPHHGDRALSVRGQDHASSAAASDPACLCHPGGQPCRGRIVFLTGTQKSSPLSSKGGKKKYKRQKKRQKREGRSSVPGGES